MGIQVNEPMTLRNGITIPSYYMCIQSDVRIMKTYKMATGREEPVPAYDVECRFNIYLDQTKSKAPITEKNIFFTSDEIPLNVYSVVYDKVKEGLTNFVDVL